MKKTVFALLLVFTTVNLFAQNASQVRLGLTAHPTFGFLKVENGKGNGLSTGFSYGLISDFEFAEQYAEMVGPNCKLYLQPEWSKSAVMTPLIVDYVMANPKWEISLQTHKFLNIP